MHIDARTLDPNATLKADIAIVGAGIAGITLAIELMDSGLSVLLIECGNYERPDAMAEDVARWQEVGIRDVEPHLCNRRVGGSGWLWGGHCRPLDPIDFEKRDWVPHSGWPIRYEDMLPHFDRALDICDLRTVPGASVAWDARQTDAQGLYPWDQVQYPLNRMGAVDFYQHALTLRLCGRVRVITCATLSDVRLSPDLRGVDHLVCKVGQTKTIRVEAQRFVLAAGGVENPSILLRADSQHECGIGNQHDLVGRFLQAHPTVDCPFLMLNDPKLPPAMVLDWSRISVTDIYRRREALRDYAFAKIGLSPQVQREHKLLNAAGLLSSFNRTDPTACWREFQQFVASRGEGLLEDDAQQKLSAYFGRTDELLRAMHMLRGGNPREDCYFILRFAAEQSPDPDSRVGLLDELDALGNRRPALDWRINELDRDSIKRTCEILGQPFEAAGIAEDRLAEPVMDPSWPRVLHGGFHYIGTTRMASDPTQGVVDTDCRVFGVRNLYVAGCSVFPTCGHAPPTFTMVALAARLARHLAPAGHGQVAEPKAAAQVGA